MRKVETRPPSFPDAPFDTSLNTKSGVRWQEICGDDAHWRIGFYSPPESSAAEIKELEQHDCPELFLLISGNLSLLLAENGKLIELPLEAGKPVLVKSPHCGFCPEGPHTGTAVVVERDSFDTFYRTPDEWLKFLSENK